MKLNTKIAAPVMLLALSACGLGTSSKDAKDNVENNFDLSGQWQTNCHAPNELSAALKTDFTQERYDFELNKTFTRDLNVWADNSCNQGVFKQTIQGNFDIVGDAPNAPAGAKAINLTITKALLTPSSADAAKNLNTLQFCKKTDWAAGQQVDVTGLDCGLPVIRKDQVIQDIYQVNGKNLNLGADSLFLNGVGDQRPTKLDTGLTYIKQ